MILAYKMSPFASPEQQEIGDLGFPNGEYKSNDDTVCIGHDNANGSVGMESLFSRVETYV